MLALLLAAGRGSRMGGPKALLDLQGETAVARCVRLLRAGGVDAIRVVAGLEADAVRAALAGGGAAAAAPAWRDIDVEVVINPDPARGQTSSVRAGLAAGLDGHAAFALHAVDHPLLEAEDVAALLAAFAGRAPGQRIAVPSVGGRRGHPALFEAELADEFLALADDEPAHRVVRRDGARVLHVPRENAWLVRDLDTPEDLAEARRALGRGAPGQPTSST